MMPQIISLMYWYWYFFFCSQKSTRDSTPVAPTMTTPPGSGMEFGSGSETGSGYGGDSSTEPESGSGEVHGVMPLMADGSWLAGLAMGDSPRTVSAPQLILAPMAALLLGFLHL